jgi:hypothetical protein
MLDGSEEFGGTRLCPQFDDFGVSPVNVGLFGFRLARSHFDPILFTSESQFISREQCSPDYTLPVHLGPVGTAKVADKQQTVGAHDQTVQFGNTALVDANITQVVLPAD